MVSLWPLYRVRNTTALMWACPWYTEAGQGEEEKNLFEVAGRYLEEWKYFYPDAQKIIPGNILDALGKYVFIKDYVYSNHAGKMKNRRSHFGIIVYVNNAPIIWVSKLQNIVEASIFGSEFVSIRISTEIIEDLW